MAVLPRSKGALSIATFDAALQDMRSTCDLSGLTFIDAYGLVGTACALCSASIDVSVPLVLPQAKNARAHLATMGFGDFLLMTLGQHVDLPVSPPTSREDVVVGLQATADSGSAQALSNLLWEQLSGNVSPQVLNALGEGVWEMIANALEHSGTDAIIMGQVYRTPRGTPPDHDNRVQVVIGDTGRGIRNSFLATGSHAPVSDTAAIHLALKYLVSSVADPGRGQELSTTMDLVLETQGSMVVRSGAGKVTITEQGRTDASVPFIPGVIVALSLPLYPGYT